MSLRLDCNFFDDNNIVKLKEELGIYGLGIYICLIELLIKNNNNYTNNYKKLSKILSCDKEILIKVIKDFNLFKINKRSIRALHLIENKNKIIKKRRKQIIKKIILNYDNKEEDVVNNKEEDVVNNKEEDVVNNKEDNIRILDLEQNLDNKYDNINNDIIEDNINNDIIEDKINYEEIMDLYNKICTKLPKIQKLTQSRKNKIKLRLKEYNLYQIELAFKLANENNFLTGSKGWKASFDWFFSNDRNISKVIEGVYNYDKINKQPKLKNNIINVSKFDKELDSTTEYLYQQGRITKEERDIFYKNYINTLEKLDFNKL